MSAVLCHSSSAFAKASGLRSANSRAALSLPAVRSGRRSAVLVRAATEYPKPTPPKGVTLPSTNPSTPPPMFGFVHWAEKMNSRAAMIGFFALLAVEAGAGKGLLEILGFSVGNGLGFEF